MTESAERRECTRLLGTLAEDARSGPEGLARMFELVYEELRALARSLMRAERPGSTLRPTALVHEAFIRLIEQDGVRWESRAHFFGIAGRAMRQILVDHAREKAALKRGGCLTRVTLEEALVPGAVSEVEVLDLDQALEKLAGLDPRASKVVEMRLFAGLGMAEIAHVLGVSKRTADDDWSMARMFLTRELAEGR